MLIKAASQLAACHVQLEQHRVNRQVVLKLQQQWVKLALVEVASGRFVALVCNRGLHVAVASYQVGTSTGVCSAAKGMNQFLQVRRQQLVIIV